MQLLWILQILLPFLVLVLAIPVVYFAVENFKKLISYHRYIGGATVYTKVYDKKTDRYETITFNMSWNGKNKDIGSPIRVYVLLATAATCILLNLVVIALLAKRRSANKFTSARKVSPCNLYSLFVIDRRS